MHCTSLQDYSPAELKSILELAASHKKNRAGYAGSLKNRNIALLFEKPSTRTRISFEAGINQLGGNALVLKSNEIQLSRGESLKDTARVFERLCDAVMIRALKHQTVTTMAQYCHIPVINGLTDMYHPCQAIADFQTIAENNIDFKDARICFLGDGYNNVCHSLVNAAALLGSEVTVACPDGYEPAPPVMEFAKEKGLNVKISRDVSSAVKGCNVLYTDVWVSMGQEAEAEKRKNIFSPFQLNEEALNMAENAIVLHWLPATKGLEITEAVFESNSSRIFDQAENRLHSQNALMMWLFKVA